MDWIVTIPKTVSWEFYQKELVAVADGSLVMSYKTRYFPKGMKVGDRCFIVNNGEVRGWMQIVGLVHALSPWRCTTTGTVWSAGKYIQRAGTFYVIKGQKMTGFRGVRKYVAP